MKIPRDKKLHFAAGLLISLSVGLAFTPWLGFSLALLAGVLKEAWDWHVYRGPDWQDMLATWAGALAGFIMTGVVKWML